VFKEHRDLPLKAAPENKVWRYVDFAKFVSLLQSESLYFASPKVLKEQDKWEAAYPTRFITATMNHFINAMTPFPSRRPKKRHAKLPQGFDPLLRVITRPVAAFVNCWHLNEAESDAMWKLYAGHGQSIAIRSTVKRLAESFSNCPDPVFLGTIEYIDYDAEPPIWTNHLKPIVHKRLSFAHEQELRAVVVKKAPEESRGILVDVNIRALIETVFVSPQSPEWFVPLVTSVLAKYDFGDLPVMSSRLDDEPK
jgi:hypothetical protein